MFERLVLADVSTGEYEQENGLSILLGADYYWTVVTGCQEKITRRLRAVQTIFGWTLQGPGPKVEGGKKIVGTSSNLFCLFTINDHDLTNFWSLDILGIKNDQQEADDETERLARECIIKGRHRYEVRMPWKNKIAVDNNKKGALVRLHSLVRRLSKVPEQLLDYDAAMREFIASGFAEPVINEEKGERIFYLPHRPVYKEDSTTTKLRIVFDASAHADCSPSLNDQLHTGSNLLPEVLKIILNFRLGKISIIADIEKAFLQIALSETDRDSHRFIWFVSPLHPQESLPNYQIYRMSRLTFGITSSPFLLAATIRFHLKTEQTQYPETCGILAESFYMDDLVLSTNSEEQGHRIYNESMSIMQRASMHLRKWNTNSSQLRQLFEASAPPEIQKVLGLQWCVISDDLYVNLEPVAAFLRNISSREGTKRNVLQLIARIYDPLGMLGPAVIGIKILFQKIWRMKLSWDAPLGNEEMMTWVTCLRDIIALKEFAIPRCVLSSYVVRREAHIFADASPDAYGTVAFVRCKNDQGDISVIFLCAKCRVAPLKECGSKDLTLPKLELTAALLAARLCAYMTKSLKFNFGSYHLWSDSQIALHWIQSDIKKWQPYVSRHVAEIREHSSIADWKHCSGKENPADLLTRGISARTLLKSSLWKRGPEWLISDVNNDLSGNSFVDIPLVVTALLAESESAPVTVKIPIPIVSFVKFSSWRRLLRITAYVLKFIYLVKEKQPSRNKYLTGPDINRAEIYWLKYIQSSEFSAELLALRNSKTLPKLSKLLSLQPILDNEGFLRVGGRLQTLQDPVDIVHPIILPKSSPITALIVDDMHQQTLHSGVGIVLTQLRQKYWIPRGRQLVKTVLKKCLFRKKMVGKPATQPFAPLPRERLIATRPFESVGVDFAGPLYIEDSENKGIIKKAYFMIFTCAVMRAIHLELTTSLSTESCLLALRRFSARRGIPSAIYSDNAKSFKKASKELGELCNVFRSEVFQGFLSQRQISWNFIVERAPWWEGFWERLIRSVKNVLKMTIRKKRLNFEQLETVLVEAEGVINSRPLTYVSDDPLDLSPLTPAHFLLGPCNTASKTLVENEVTASHMQMEWKQRRQSTSLLWKCWRNEYLQQLRSFHAVQQRPVTQLKEGEVVLVFDPTKPRIHWKLAVIESTFPGRDGKVRACLIRYADGTTMRRPVQLLYPLELSNLARGEDVKN